MGFEPTRAEHIGLAVQRLNHSATSSHVSHETHFMSSVLSIRNEFSLAIMGVTLAAKSLLRRRQNLCGDLPIEVENLSNGSEKLIDQSCFKYGLFCFPFLEDETTT